MALVETRMRSSAATLTDTSIAIPAIGEAFKKLHPRVMIRNPVMFVVEVVALLTTVLFVRDLVTGSGEHYGFAAQIIVWLWFTIVFANFAEAIAEGRGKAQAATLRRAKTETMAKLLSGKSLGEQGEWREIAGTALKPGDIVLVEAGDMIPSDG